MILFFLTRQEKEGEYLVTHFSIHFDITFPPIQREQQVLGHGKKKKTETKRKKYDKKKKKKGAEVKTAMAAQRGRHKEKKPQ